MADGSCSVGGYESPRGALTDDAAVLAALEQLVSKIGAGNVAAVCARDGRLRCTYAIVVVTALQEAVFQPSDPQRQLMASLCQQLGLNFNEVTAPLSTHDLYSDKLDKLLKAKHAQQAAGNELVRAAPQPNRAMVPSPLHPNTLLSVPRLVCR